jgi:hypothetical protein
MNDPKYKKRSEDNDLEIKEAIDRKPVSETRFEIRNIWLEKVKEESALKTKIIKSQLPTKKMEEQMSVIEMYKINDAL